MSACARNNRAVVLAACLITVCTSCQPHNEHFVVENGLDVPVQTWPSDSPELFPPEEDNFDSGLQPGEAWPYSLVESGERPWYHRVWPFRDWAPEACRDDLYIHVYAEDGRTWTREPPLCSDEVWVIDG